MLVVTTVCGGGGGDGGSGGNGYTGPTDPGNGSNPPATCTPSGSTVCLGSNLTYMPATITIARNSSVTWTNDSGITHSVTFDTPGSPVSSQLFSSGNFVAVFPNAGTFAYHCSVHGQAMSGTVVVQ